MLGLLPDTEGEVEAETPGARWVVLGTVPADRAEGRKRPSCPESCPSPGWGGDSLLHPPAWPKPAGESHRARAPLPGKQAQGWGAGSAWLTKATTVEKWKRRGSAQW